VVKRWTWEECLVLKEFYNTMPVKELIETKLPARTESAITTKVKVLRNAGWKFRERPSRLKG